jgi:hypothetical protein
MFLPNRFLSPLPGDSSSQPEPNQNEPNQAKDDGTKNTDHPSLKDKVKVALQEWSIDNERVIEEDDSTPLRSGL